MITTISLVNICFALQFYLPGSETLLLIPITMPGLLLISAPENPPVLSLSPSNPCFQPSSRAPPPQSLP